MLFPETTIVWYLCGGRRADGGRHQDVEDEDFCGIPGGSGAKGHSNSGTFHGWTFCCTVVQQLYERQVGIIALVRYERMLISKRGKGFGRYLLHSRQLRVAYCPILA